jgi:2-methylisocitrate lyase-like PEP mutase family enzyme
MDRLRRLINADKILVLPGVFDGLSARLLKHRGYETAFISGAGISESRLGLPDIGLMGFNDSVAAAAAIVECSGLLCIADADTGYGNAVNTFRTVQAFERAGVAGVMIEDQVWPKRCGHMRGKEVISADEMVEKVAAAVEARRNDDLVVMARTDAFGTHGLAEAIRRLNMYAEAGADLLFADALLSESDIRTAAAETSGPLCVNMGFGIRRRPTTELISVQRLEEIGVAVAIYPRLLTASAVSGMMKALDVFEQSIDSANPVEAPELVMSQEDYFKVMGLADFLEREAGFAGAATRVLPSAKSRAAS